MVFTLALSIATIVALPWLAARRNKSAGLTFILSFVAATVLVYFFTPTIAGPFFGGVGRLTILLLFFSGFIGFVANVYIPTFVGLGAVLLYCVTAVIYSPIFQAQNYAALVPQIEPREWSADFQPKDPRHFRVSSSENAVFLAGRATVSMHKAS